MLKVTRSTGDCQATLWQLPGKHPLEMLKASYSTHSFPRHWHETYVIQVVEQGTNEFSCEGKAWKAPQRSIVLINPYEVHNGCSAGGSFMKYRSFYPCEGYLRDVVSQMDDRIDVSPFFSRSVIQDPALAGMILRTHIKTESDQDSIHLQSMLLELFSKLVCKYSDRRIRIGDISITGSLKFARDYIQDNFAQNISLNQLAEICGLSPFHFLRTFQKMYRLSPHEFLKNVRIERARELLKKGLSITEVAGATGFYDQSHLNRNFKKLLGLTPGQYRVV
jgi:AraC-like DNA-binding protein